MRPAALRGKAYLAIIEHMSTLETAIKLATDAHSGQLDMSGQPYILHPIRVMLRVSHPSTRIVAILHDVIEDTPITLAEIERHGFSQEIIEALRLVTHDKDSLGYVEYVQRIRDSENTIAIEVKLADLADNMDPLRLKHLKPGHRRVLQDKHRAALKILQK